jgi:hypothetical protein
MLMRPAVVICVASAILAACGQSVDPLDIPSVYDASSFTSNAAAELQVRRDFADLVTLMRTGRTQGTVIDADQMASIATKLPTGSFADLVTSTIPELAKASGGTYDPRRSVADNGHGGVYGAYLFDETGLEPEQIIDKGLFGAMMYASAAKLMKAGGTSADIDRILAWYGADPSFPNSDKAATPDRGLAGYAARRDKNDGAGMYTTLATAFRKAKAAAARGGEREEELQQALSTIRTTWERVLMATVVNYILTTMQTISATNPTDDAVSAALHAYGEAVGFSMGMLYVDPSERVITDAALRSILEGLQVTAQGATTSYRLVTEPVAALADLQSALQTIATTYGFTSSEIEDFRQNWVNVQQR